MVVILTNAAVILGLVCKYVQSFVVSFLFFFKITEKETNKNLGYTVVVNLNAVISFHTESLQFLLVALHLDLGRAYLGFVLFLIPHRFAVCKACIAVLILKQVLRKKNATRIDHKRNRALYHLRRRN